MHHFVYWLFDSEDHDLLYIGRTFQPERRKRDFERLHQLKTISGVSNRYSRIEDAQAHELQMIKLHMPPYNKKVASSPASFGIKRGPPSEETRAKMRAAKLGGKLTEEHKQKIGLAGMGNQRRLGTKQSKETRAKMSASHLLRLGKYPHHQLLRSSSHEQRLQLPRR